MADTSASGSIQSLLTVTEEESEQLGLKRVPHGLILMSDQNDYRWTKVTSDMDYFAVVVATVVTSEVGSAEKIFIHVTKFPIMFHGWPGDGIGDIPDLPDPERD